MIIRAAGVCLVLLLSGGPADAQDRPQAPMPPRDPPADRWVYSETVSPLDYAPVVTASAWAGDPSQGPALQLSIQCRRGRTDLVVASPALPGRPEELRVVWAVNDELPSALQLGAASTATAVLIKDDVLRLLSTLPAKGELSLQVTGSQAPPLHGRYAIAPLKTVLGRMAAPCKWPAQHSLRQPGD